jgi:peptide/nickel transport system permease protein
MYAYIIRRVLLIIPTFFLVTMLVFALMRFIPGDVIDQMMSQMGQTQGGSDEGVDREALARRLGLDEPLMTQYARWMGLMPNREGKFSGVLQGDFGRSLWGNRRPVMEELVARIPVTLELGILAILVGTLIALPIGIFSAIRQDTVGDYTGRSFAIICIAVPGFWIGTMVMVLPAVWWRWTPSMEYIPLVKDPLGNLQMFIIPAAILGMVLSGTTMRMTRTMMLEVLRQDYIRTAWSKGLRERVVVVRHALKNAFIPVITILGLQIPLLVGGAVITEQIFNLPGVGRLLLNALSNRDYVMVSGVNVFVATVVLLSNLMIDVTYAFLDPRIRIGK